MRSLRRRSRAAFTLIELLVVVVIIAILAAIAVNNMLNARIRANIARIQADFRAIADAHGAYQIDHGVFIPDPRFRRDRIYTSGGNETDRALSELTSPVAYISAVPSKDPFAWKSKRPLNVDRDGFVEWSMLGAKYNYFNEIGPPRNPGLNDIIHGEWVVLTHKHADIGGPLRYKWKLVSNGPAPRKIELGGWRVYDPTNGLKSGGAIIHYGPQ